MRRQRGNTTVEFVLAVTVVLPLLAGIVDSARFMGQWQAVSRIARDGGRLASGVPLPAGLDSEAARVALSTVVLPEVRDTVVASGFPCADCVSLAVQDVAVGGGFGVREFSLDVEVPFHPLFGVFPLPASIRSTFWGATDRQDLDVDFTPITPV